VQFTPSTGYSRFTVPSNSCGRPRSESHNPSQAYALRPRRPRHSAPTEELGKVQFWTLAHGCGAASASQHSDHRACQQAGPDHFDRLGSRTQLRNTHRMGSRVTEQNRSTEGGQRGSLTSRPGICNSRRGLRIGWRRWRNGLTVTSVTWWHIRPSRASTRMRSGVRGYP
jgi:hypothetical protein